MTPCTECLSAVVFITSNYIGNSEMMQVRPPFPRYIFSNLFNNQWIFPRVFRDARSLGSPASVPYGTSKPIISLLPTPLPILTIRVGFGCMILNPNISFTTSFAIFGQPHGHTLRKGITTFTGCNFFFLECTRIMSIFISIHDGSTEAIFIQRPRVGILWECAYTLI